MPRTQIYTCTTCGQIFNGTAAHQPPGWYWRGSKLLCDDCTGNGLYVPAQPIPAAPASSAERIAA